MLVASTAVSCGMSVECKNPYEKGKAEPQNRTADTKNLTEDAEDVMRFLRIDSAGENFWYSIDALSLDINKKDYSDVYEAFLTPIKNPAEKDRTCDFVEGRLRLDTAFSKPLAPGTKLLTDALSPACSAMISGVSMFISILISSGRTA